MSEQPLPIDTAESVVRRKSLKLNREQFLLVMKKTGGRCAYCGEPKWPHRNGSSVTIDHVIPTTSGGDDSLENLVPCCRSCNASKSNLTLEDYRHRAAQLAMEWPNFTVAQISWLREYGFDLSMYDEYKFWFEGPPEWAK